MKYYTVFEDETLEEAISKHSSGFDSVEDALLECKLCDEDIKFEIVSKYELITGDIHEL